MSEECTCHLHPPCPFCTSLDEQEADAFCSAHGGSKGVAAVMAVRARREECVVLRAEREQGPSAVASAGGYIPRRLKDVVILGPDMYGDDVGGDP